MIPEDPHALRGTRGQRPTLGTANLSPLSLLHWGPRTISGVAAEFLTEACSLPMTVTALWLLQTQESLMPISLDGKIHPQLHNRRNMRTSNQGSLHHVMSRQHSLPSKLWALLKVKENFSFLVLYSLPCPIESLACRRFQLWKTVYWLRNTFTLYDGAHTQKNKLQNNM